MLWVMLPLVLTACSANFATATTLQMTGSVGCYISVSLDPSGNLAITLGYDVSNQEQYLNLAGTAQITSSSFGQQPITYGGSFIGNYYYSDGTFVMTSAPEPAAAALLVCESMLLVACRRSSTARTTRNLPG